MTVGFTVRLLRRNPSVLLSYFKVARLLYNSSQLSFESLESEVSG